jgi:hypothetical protein
MSREPPLDHTANCLKAFDDGHGTALSPIEQGILQCLGAAVISQWSDLPTEVQKALFHDAVSIEDPRQSTSLREQIARFLHNHKDDADKPAP